MEEISVFISKVGIDYQSAKRLKGKLQRQNVDVFISEETAKGQNWMEEIERELEKADVLIMIYRGPPSLYTWCIYEVGLFTKLGKGSNRKPVICIHSPGVTIPNQLSHLQAVCGDTEGIYEFLMEFFGGDSIINCGENSPLALGYVNNTDEVLNDAKYIAESTSPRDENQVEEVYFYNRVLKIDILPAKENSNRISADSVLHASSLTFEIFDLKARPVKKPNWRWKDVVDQMEQNNQSEWMEELNESFELAVTGRGLKPIQSRLVSLTSGKTYIPTIHKISVNNATESVSLEVTLVHIAGGSATQAFAS